MRHDVLHQQKRPAQIDRHHAVPQANIDFGALGFLKRRKQSRVVDDDIDLAEPLHGFGDQSLDRGLVADVGNGAFDRIGAVLARKRCSDVLAVGDIGDHQASAFGNKGARIVLAYSFGAAG